MHSTSHPSGRLIWWREPYKAVSTPGRRRVELRIHSDVFESVRNGPCFVHVGYSQQQRSPPLRCPSLFLDGCSPHGRSDTGSETGSEEGSYDTAASNPEDIKEVADSSSPGTIAPKQPAFNLGLELGTPPPTIKESEAVTTEGGAQTWPRKQGDLTLEEALVLPPGTSIASLALDQENEVALRDVIVLPREYRSDLLEGQTAAKTVDDSYGEGQIILDGRVVTG